MCHRKLYKNKFRVGEWREKRKKTLPEGIESHFRFGVKCWTSILLHSGLNPAWIQFFRFSRGCKPRENIWNCSRKYPKMFKTDSFLGNKKLSLNQNVWRDHATMQQDILLHFWVIFLYWNQAEIWKKIFCCSALELFHCLPQWKTVLFVSSRAFSLSSPIFLLSTSMENSEAT